ncbi:MAG: ABC transporter ATP-binding protein [Candidatus Margulisbacteria bacterium]|nr:ABC transporter ATP-binding protein [Candidatus Margulisiibacteriota bacterium]
MQSEFGWIDWPKSFCYSFLMLDIKELSVSFGNFQAVKDVGFSLKRGETLGLLGESGSGKSTVALAIMRLISYPGKIISGKILLDGADLIKLGGEEMRKIRGAKISMIFQDPFSSLNPVFTVGEQIAEAFRYHQGLNRVEAWERSIEMLGTVQIRNPSARIHNYPHQFSGGMRQRVMIAMALACNPEFLIADEPTTALDVTVQAEILKLIADLQNKFKLGVLFITHNFAIIKQICDRVVVMRKGQVMEEGATLEVLNNSRNAYTKNLIESVKVLAGE